MNPKLVPGLQEGVIDGGLFLLGPRFRLQPLSLGEPLGQALGVLP